MPKQPAADERWPRLLRRARALSGRPDRDRPSTRDRPRRARAGADRPRAPWHRDVESPTVQGRLAFRERRLFIHPDPSEMVSVRSASTHQIPADTTGTIYSEITNHSHARCGEGTR